MINKRQSKLKEKKRNKRLRILAFLCCFSLFCGGIFLVDSSYNEMQTGQRKLSIVQASRDAEGNLEISVFGKAVDVQGIADSVFRILNIEK